MTTHNLILAGSYGELLPRYPSPHNEFFAQEIQSLIDYCIECVNLVDYDKGYCRILLVDFFKKKEIPLTKYNLFISLANLLGPAYFNIINGYNRFVCPALGNLKVDDWNRHFQAIEKRPKITESVYENIEIIIDWNTSLGNYLRATGAIV